MPPTTSSRRVCREEAQELLRQHGILPAGRFGRWHFQGIAESLAEGLLLGATLR